MLPTRLSSLALLLAFSLVACGSQSNRSDPDPILSAPGEVARSDLQRDTDPDVATEDALALVTDNANFALDLLGVLAAAKEDENLFFSPHSISIALGMTYGGARGETETDIATTLHFNLDQEHIHPAFNDLDLELAAQNNEDFELTILNQMWGRIGETFVPEYLDLLAVNYGAGLRLLDFAGAPEPSRITINEWVEEVTKDRIKDLLPPNSITSSTALVLTNAIYFKAQWLLGFIKEATAPADFHLDDGSTVSVDMMRQSSEYRHGAGDSFQAIELPYENTDMAMLVVVPDTGNLAALESSMDAATLSSIVDGLAWKWVNLALPKIEFEAGMSLKGALQDLGMVTPFTPAANFTGIRASGNLMIADVIHKGFVMVDEDGTEAAAATAVILGDTSVSEPPESINLTINRPYLFFIRDTATGVVLFVGRVLDPTA